MPATSPTRDGGPSRSGVAAVLAVKRLDDAKSRLATAVPATDRRDLVAAMLLDTIAACRAAGADPVVVVSPDPAVRTLAASAGADGVDEPTAPPDATGGDIRFSTLNIALTAGIAAAAPAARTIVVVQPDLPALTPEVLRDAVGEAEAALATGAPAALVADRAGEGTVLLAVPAGPSFAPRFGPASAAHHRGAGAVELDPARRRWSGLRTDVDTADDLGAARALGVGPETTTVLRGLRRVDATASPRWFTIDS